MRLFLQLTLLSCIFACSTQQDIKGEYDPFAKEYLQSEPSKTSLPGTYVPDGVARKWLDREGFSGVNPRLVLNKDGTFALTHFPQCIVVWMPDCKGDLRSEIGKWTTRKESKGWSLVLIPNDQNCECPPYDLDYYLRGNSPAYKIHMSDGDSIVGRLVVLEKIGA